MDKNTKKALNWLIKNNKRPFTRMYANEELEQLFCECVKYDLVRDIDFHAEQSGKFFQIKRWAKNNGLI
jgi:hypothetical protein